MDRTSWKFIALIMIALLSACTSVPDTGHSMPPPTAASTPTAPDNQPARLSPTTSTLPRIPTRTAPTALTGHPSSTPPVRKTAAAGTKIVPSSTPGPTPLACWKKGGRIETGSLETSLLRLPLAYRVYLPPCYDQQPNRHYPVLYLFHGQSFNDDQWDRMGADETADRLIAAGETASFLIVMPFERYGGQPTENKFDQAFMEVLLPYVEKTYRTVPARSHRAVGGLSRGAGWAVHFGIWQADFFSAIGAHSPAVFHTDAQRMRTWLSNLAPSRYPRIYVDIGERDRPEILRSAEWFVKLLDEFDMPHDWHLFTGYHNEDYWSAHMEQYLRWYSQDW